MMMLSTKELVYPRQGLESCPQDVARTEWISALSNLSFRQINEVKLCVEMFYRQSYFRYSRPLRSVARFVNRLFARQRMMTTKRFAVFLVEKNIIDLESQSYLDFIKNLGFISNEDKRFAEVNRALLDELYNLRLKSITRKRRRKCHLFYFN